MDKWNGCKVSVICGGTLGVYQGSVLMAERANITLGQVFHNGYPFLESSVTINSMDIKKLTIIETANKNIGEATYGTGPNTKESKTPHRPDNLQNVGSYRAEESKTLSYLNTGYNKNAGNGLPLGPRNVRWLDDDEGKHNKNNYMGETTGNKGNYRRIEALLFNPSNEPTNTVQQEFDFEKHLSHNNNIWKQLNNSQKPDVRHQAARMNGDMRDKENVLPSFPALNASMQVPDDKRDRLVYVTDEGLVMPSVTARLRSDLFNSLDQLGLLDTVTMLLARTACDMALKLLGGERRLEQSNAHQVPTVVVLVGAHKAGKVGLTCAEFLVSHRVKTIVHVSGQGPPIALFKHLAQYRMAGPPHRVVASVDELPNADLILVALASHNHADSVQYSEAAEWTRFCRAPVIALDPPASGTVGVVAKVSVVAAVPLAHGPENGQVYLANTLVPVQMFRDFDIEYSSPFGSKNHVALHPA